MSAKKTEASHVRVAPWHRPVAVYDAVSGEYVVPSHDELYRADEPVVLAHGWLFATEEEIAAARAAASTTEVGGASVAIPDMPSATPSQEGQWRV